MESFKNLDQTNFVCIDLPDKSFYYGEIAYLDENDNIVIKNSKFIFEI